MIEKTKLLSGLIVILILILIGVVVYFTQFAPLDSGDLECPDLVCSDCPELDCTKCPEPTITLNSFYKLMQSAEVPNTHLYKVLSQPVHSFSLKSDYFEMEMFPTPNSVPRFLTIRTRFYYCEDGKVTEAGRENIHEVDLATAQFIGNDHVILHTDYGGKIELIFDPVSAGLKEYRYTTVDIYTGEPKPFDSATLELISFTFNPADNRVEVEKECPPS